MAQAEPVLKGLRLRIDKSVVLKGLRVWVGKAFSSSLPLTGVVEQKHSVVGHSPIIRGGAD